MMYDLQKANMWKRISAFIFDSILLGILAVGLAFLFSTVFGMDGYNAQMDACYTRYEEEYHVSFDTTQAEYDALPEEEKTRYDEASRALFSDPDMIYAYNMIISLTLLIISLSILFAYLILEFLVPILFRNGQTLGKKVFGIGVMRFDGVKIGTPILFVRTLLGKYTLETMVPVLIILMLFFGFIGWVGLLILAAILVMQIGFTFATKTHTPLHDVIANSVTVDMASQMIFDSQEDMLAYKKRIHAEESSRAEY